MAKTTMLHLVVTTVITASLAGGCAPGRTGSSRKLTVQLQPSPQVELPQPSATWRGGLLKVSGVVRRKSDFNGPVAGHVHVDLLSADHELLDQVLLQWRPAAIPVDGARQATYRVTYVWDAPPVSVIRVAVVDDEQEHLFPTPESSGGSVGSSARGSRGSGLRTPTPLGKPRAMARTRTPQPRQKSSTPGTPRGISGGRR